MGGAGYLSGMKVALDVQHLYRPNHPSDQGTVYHLANGYANSSSITEAHCTLIYAGAIHEFLASWGAEVLTNDAGAGVLTGFYSQRNHAAGLWGADLYLACHLNAGGGSYAAIEMMAAHRDDRLTGFIGTELTQSVPEIRSSRAVGLGQTDRGAVCIRDCSCPAAILEPFFGDTPSQQGLMAAGRLLEVGQAIARGVGSWWRGGHIA
jgi:N-acetylmuramoyl-L-alanine amidase